MTVRHNTIPKVALQLDEAFAEALEAALEEVVAEAQARVPVASSRLQQSIHVERVDENSWAVRAGDGGDIYYGHIVEHGSVYGPGPRPYLVPALEARREKILQAARLEVQRLIDRGRT